VKRYDTVDFIVPLLPSTLPHPTGVFPPPALTTFNAADGSRLEVLNDSTGSFRIVTPGDSVPHYGRAVEIIYQPTLAREYFAQRAAQ
jgi:hypothetical protein